MAEFMQTTVEKPQELFKHAKGGSVSNRHTSSSGQPYMASSYSETSSLRLDQLGNKVKTPPFLYLLTFFSAIGGFLFGYDSGVISGAMILLRDQFHLDSVWQEMIISTTIGAAALFALIGGLLNDRIGRKPVILVASMLFMAGSVCMALAPTREVILIARIIVGSGIGLTSTTIPMYIAEASPIYARGRLVSTNILMVAGGQFVANVVDGLFSFERDGWRYMLGFGGIPALIQLIGFLFLPESPHWLIVTGNEDKARLVLHKIRGSEDIEEEFETIKQTCWEEDQNQMDSKDSLLIVKMLKTPSVRRALVIGCSLQIIQQFTGINGVIYYCDTIIKMSGVRSESAAIWLGAVTAAVNFTFTCVGVYLVEKIGRRPLTLISLMGVIGSLVWLAISFNLTAVYSPEIDIHEQVSQGTQCDTYGTCDQCMRDKYCGYCYLDSSNGPMQGSCLPSLYNDYVGSEGGQCNATELPGKRTWAYDYCPTSLAWMPMVGLVLHFLFFAPGMGPMPWTINSEIYPLWARSTGNAAATFTNWTCNLAVSMSFLSLTEVLTRYGTFWLYAGISTIGVIVLALFLPETKGKSLEEVEGLFARSWLGSRSQPVVPFAEKSVQYVHIRGLNRGGEESDLDSPE